MPLLKTVSPRNLIVLLIRRDTVYTHINYIDILFCNDHQKQGT